MTLIPYDHFREMDKLLAGRTPKADVYEKGNNVVAEIEMPGIDLKNINIELKENVLEVEAKTEEKKEEKDKGYYRKELSRGYYKRVFPLPVKVKGKADASYDNGVLKIVIPKAVPKKTAQKKVKIKVKTKK